MNKSSNKITSTYLTDRHSKHVGGPTVCFERERSQQLRQLRGYISTSFAEVDDKVILEHKNSTEIREITINDHSKHFKNWYSKLDDFAEDEPDEILFELLVHGEYGYVYGYFNRGRLDGTIRVEDAGDYYLISFFFVNPAIQNQGAGQQLFRYVLARFKDKNLRLNVYTDNERAIHIYRKYGFRIIGIGRDVGCSPNCEHYIMRRMVTVKANPPRDSLPKTITMKVAVGM